MARQFSTRSYKKLVRRLLEPLEVVALARYYFSLQKSLNMVDKLRVYRQYLRLRGAPPSPAPNLEISFLLYSKACERMTIPLILDLLQHPAVKAKGISIHVIVLSGIQNLRLTTANVQKLAALGGQIERDYFSLIHACHQPEGKAVVLCLDHCQNYQYHHWGIDAVHKLREFGVKTFCMQHGGTRQDSVSSLASSASDLLLIWGKRVYRELIDQYQVPQKRLRLVGNPLHDPLLTLDRDHILQTLADHYPVAQEALKQNKRLILLATCLHTEYRGLGDEHSLYQSYIRHIYQSLDFSQVFLVVKMHPLDTLDPNLYLEAVHALHLESSICVIEPNVTALDCYSLLSIAEVLMTRASTVAEEALLMGKKVVAFDLMADGPAQSYRHLQDYGNYTTTYLQPKDALRQAISKSLQTPVDSTVNSTDDITAEFTYCLDGHSTRRATDTILAELSDARVSATE